MTLSLLRYQSTVDWHYKNIFFKSATFEVLTNEGVYSCLGEPEMPVERLDKGLNGPEVPRYCVPPAMIFQSRWSIPMGIMMSDFDVFFLQNQERTGLQISIELLQPEVSLSILSGLLHSLRDPG
jgi:hypothetical protein